MLSITRRVLSLSLAALMCVAPLGNVPLASAQPPAELPIVVLEHEVAGQAAINALGADLQKVAAAHGKSVSELARALKDDKSLHVDTKGRLVYKEEALPADLAAESCRLGPLERVGRVSAERDLRAAQQPRLEARDLPRLRRPCAERDRLE